MTGIGNATRRIEGRIGLAKSKGKTDHRLLVWNLIIGAAADAPLIGIKACICGRVALVAGAKIAAHPETPAVAEQGLPIVEGGASHHLICRQFEHLGRNGLVVDDQAQSQSWSSAKTLGAGPERHQAIHDSDR